MIMVEESLMIIRSIGDNINARNRLVVGLRELMRKRLDMAMYLCLGVFIISTGMSCLPCILLMNIDGLRLGFRIRLIAWFLVT